MADIFISYAFEDRSRVEPLAKALEDQGWSVFWDLKIPVGKTFEEIIEEGLDAAKCAIVVWSKFSIISRWVKAEAEEGLNRNILVPVSIDIVKIPLLFRPIHSVRLTHWEGDSKHPQFVELISDLTPILGPSPLKDKGAKRKAEEEPKRNEIEAQRKIEEKRKRNEENEERKRKEVETKLKKKEPEIGNIFISYSRKDQAYVRELTDYLEDESLSVWVDDRIEHGDRWWRAIVANIRKCAAMIVIMTPESEETDWVEREYFFANKINKPLFPLLLKGECFPFFVNQQYHDVRDGSMPPWKFIARLRRLCEEERNQEKGLNVS